MRWPGLPAAGRCCRDAPRRLPRCITNPHFCSAEAFNMARFGGLFHLAERHLFRQFIPDPTK
jgi:hypothetical protein